MLEFGALEQAAKRRASCGLRLIQGARHYVQVDKPQRVAAAILGAGTG